MARLGGNRARALFQVMPVPFGSSMTGAGRPLRAPSGVDDTPRALLLRWRTVGSATMDELRQIPSPGGVSQVLRRVVSGDSAGDGAGCGGEGAVGGGRCIRAVTSGVVMVQVEREMSSSVVKDVERYLLRVGVCLLVSPSLTYTLQERRKAPGSWHTQLNLCSLVLSISYLNTTQYRH